MRLSYVGAIACSIAVACSTPAPRALERNAPGANANAKPVAGFTAPDARGFGRAGELIFFEEIVGDAKVTDRLPMVVLIHGRGDRPRAGWLPLQLPKPVRVIMPQAPLPYGDAGFSWSRARASDAAGPSGEQLGLDLKRMSDQIDAALTILKAARPTLGSPLIAGFSQGGMLSYALAVLHPRSCTLAIPISGLLPNTLWPSAKPSGPLPLIRALHGTADYIVPIEPARAAITHLAKIGYDATLTEQLNVDHTISPDMLAEVNEWLSEAL